MVISSCSEVEFISAPGVKLRTRQITDSDAQRAVDTYTRLVSPCLHRIPVHNADHRKAAILLYGWKTAFRAGDGLHLASADTHKAPVFTFDKGMLKAGETLGIDVRLLTITE